MKMWARIEAVDGGFIVETKYDSGEPHLYVFTDFVKAITKVAANVGFLSDIVIQNPPPNDVRKLDDPVDKTA